MLTLIRFESIDALAVLVCDWLRCQFPVRAIPGHPAITDLRGVHSLFLRGKTYLLRFRSVAA